MNVLAILGLVIVALQELEKSGVIKIGGYEPTAVDAILTSVGNILKSIPHGNNPGGAPTPLNSTPEVNPPGAS